MTRIAKQFPARRQPDGVVWYRGVDHDGKLDMGWTSNRAMAHPDYLTDDAPEPLDVNPAELEYRPPTEQEVEIMASAIGAKFDQAMDQTTTTTIEETPMTALTEDFEDYNPPRETQWEGYPLPPAAPRHKQEFNGWGWYKLPAPTTGMPSAFPRATTIADTLDDTYGLSRWKRRETAVRLYELAKLPPDTQLHKRFDTTAADALKQLVKAMNGTKVTAIDTVLDTIDNLMGASHSRELGECVHAWLEALCLGQVLHRDVPDLVRPHIDAAFEVMGHRGIISRPEYVERVVLNDQGEETVAGRIDCIWELADTGELVLGDWKTNKDLQYSWLSYGVQIGGVYGWATKLLTTDGKGWEPMPKLRGIPHPDDHDADCPVRDTHPLFGDDDCIACDASADQRSAFAILLHIPSDQPERAAAITIDMFWGGEVMAESLATRRRRKEAKSEVPRHAIPAPSDRALRIVAARLALTKIASLEEGEAVYETYQDVWNDDLGEFAEKIAELF